MITDIWFVQGGNEMPPRPCLMLRRLQQYPHQHQQQRRWAMLQAE